MRFNAASQSATAGTSRLRRETWNGEEYLVAPVVAQQEGVYAYPVEGGGVRREFVPGEELTTNSASWEGIPLVLRHPTNSTGEFVSFEESSSPNQVGAYRNVDTTDDGLGLSGEVWIQESEVGEYDGDLQAYVDGIEHGGYGEVSTGYDAGRIEPDRGTYNGSGYEYVQRELSPDHLALLPDEIGNCSVSDGCGVGRANEAPSGEESSGFRTLSLQTQAETDLPDGFFERIGERVSEALGLTDTTPTHPSLTGDTPTDEPSSDELAESSSGPDTTSMKDEEKIDVLVENHGLDRENLVPLKGEDCLTRIHERFVEPESEGETESETETADAQTETKTNDGTTTTEESLDTDAIQELVDKRVNEAVAERLDEEADNIASLVDEAQQTEQHIQRIDASDDIDLEREDLEGLDPDAVAKMADSLPEEDDQEEKRANMHGLATGSSVDLSSDDDVDVAVAGNPKIGANTEGDD